MNPVSTEVLLLFFSSSLPICPIHIFSSYIHITQYGENVDGANGRTGGKNSSSTFVLTAFISFGLF
jgi:hypothetical protein